ncbi:MAG: hypothetical protein KF893_18665 [Caldilineaceae bacterium]|nr:hypothetical protein [Caldilineaceae bacterium]
MSGSWYYFTPSQGITATSAPPKEGRPFRSAVKWIEPATLPQWHRGFQAWGKANRSPGLVTPERIWLAPEGIVAFHFTKGEQPAIQSAVGGHAGLAAWLVLLDKSIETQTVLDSAGAVWPSADLAGALAFTAPALLPASLLTMPPQNWERLARALAHRIANGSHQLPQENHAVHRI